MTDIEIIQEEIKKHPKTKQWYVLRYDVKTTEYKNEIVFKTYKQALKEFKNTMPHDENERVELMFAPKNGDNIVAIYKTWQTKNYQHFI